MSSLFFFSREKNTGSKHAGEAAGYFSWKQDYSGGSHSEDQLESYQRNHQASQVALAVKNLPANAGRFKRREFNIWVGKIPWSWAQQPTPVFLPGVYHGQRSLAGCSPQGRIESDTTEATARTRVHSCRTISVGSLNLSWVAVWPKVCASKQNMCTLHLQHREAGILLILWVSSHLIPDTPVPKLQGALETITELLKGETILTGPQIGYSTFREPLESRLSLHFTAVFSKYNFLISWLLLMQINISMLKRKSPPSLESSSDARDGAKAEACKAVRGSLDIYLCALGEKAWYWYLEEKSLPSLIKPLHLINVRILYQMTLQIIKCYTIVAWQFKLGYKTSTNNLLD